LTVHADQHAVRRRNASVSSYGDCTICIPCQDALRSPARRRAMRYTESCRDTYIPFVIVILARGARSMRFIDKLRDAQQQKDSWLCVGLDPNPELIPPGVSLKTFCQTIIDAPHEQACSFKFNLALFLIYRPEGFATLVDMIAALPHGTQGFLAAYFGDHAYSAYT